MKYSFAGFQRLDLRHPVQGTKQREDTLPYPPEARHLSSRMFHSTICSPQALAGEFS